MNNKIEYLKIVHSTREEFLYNRCVDISKYMDERSE